MQDTGLANRPPLVDEASRFGICFRNMTTADLPFMAGLYWSTREDELSITPWSEAEKTAFIEMQFQAQHDHYQKHYPDALWLVIERRGQAIGRLYLERWSREHRIIDIAIMPAQRRQGIGEALLRDLMTEAAAVAKSISIHVEKNNPAMALYRRLGFMAIEDKGVYDLLLWTPPATQTTSV